MISMSMSAEVVWRALAAAKGDDDLARRYLGGDRQAFQHMLELLQAACPDSGAIDTGKAAHNDAGLAGLNAVTRAPATPSSDGGKPALHDWLLKAREASFARHKSPAH